MPISYGAFERQIKLLPIVIHVDGSMHVTVKCGYLDTGVFNAVSEETHVIPAAVANALLDMPSQVGVSRRDDLSHVVYSWLISSNCLKTGAIS